MFDEKVTEDKTIIPANLIISAVTWEVKKRVKDTLTGLQIQDSFLGVLINHVPVFCSACEDPAYRIICTIRCIKKLLIFSKDDNVLYNME